MRAPICSICLKSDMLCSACKAKVDSGRVTAYDIQIARTLENMSKKIKTLREVSIKMAIDGFDDVIIVTRKGDCARIVGREGIVVKELSRIIGKNVKVIDEYPDISSLIESLLNPVHVMGMNVLYTPEGEFLKVIVPKGSRLPISEQSFKDALKHTYRKDVRIVFE